LTPSSSILPDEDSSPPGSSLPFHERPSSDAPRLTWQPCTCSPLAASSRETAADHDRARVCGQERRISSRRVVVAYERRDSVAIEPVDRRHPRRAARRQQQACRTAHGRRRRQSRAWYAVSTLDDAHADVAA
jgi:hypothetical protein